MVVVHGRPVYALTEKSIITLPNTPFKLTWKKLRCNFDMYMSRATKTFEWVSEVKPKARESRYIKLKAVWKFDEYNIQSYLDINVLKAESWNVAWKKTRLRLAFPCSTEWLNNFLRYKQINCLVSTSHE